MIERADAIAAPRASSHWQRARAFAVAVLIAVAWGSLVQSQFNIASLESIGAVIDLATRLRISALDLIGFTPIYAVIVLLAFACALPCAAWLQRRHPRWRMAVYAFAGALGIAVAIRVVDAATPAPTLIAATRGSGGWLLMAIGGAWGGAWFARR